MRGANARLRNSLWVLVVCACAGAQGARAEMAVLLEEPFGLFGAMNPTGHAALYFSRVCADSPHHLRRCAAGESGVVISRYHEVAGYDWLAIPLVPYLYAVERPEEVPLFASEQVVADLRDAYRQKALYELIPDRDNGESPDGEWIQLIGSSYDRRIYSFKIETSQAQDDLLIERLNSRSNRARFNLFFHNCADFVRTVINWYYPHAVRRSFLADAGLTTPKQVAKSLVKYSRKHPELRLTSFVIPQIGGDSPRSRKTRGVLESLLMSKKYVVPIALLHPVIATSLAVGYVTGGRFDPRRQITNKGSIEWEPARIVAQFKPEVAQDIRVAASAATSRARPSRRSQATHRKCAGAGMLVPWAVSEQLKIIGPNLLAA